MHQMLVLIEYGRAAVLSCLLRSKFGRRPRLGNLHALTHMRRKGMLSGTTTMQFLTPSPVQTGFVYQQPQPA